MDYSLTQFGKVHFPSSSGNDLLNRMRTAFGAPMRRRSKDSGLQEGEIVYMDVATCNDSLSSVIPKVFSGNWRAEYDGLVLEPLQLVPFDITRLGGVKLGNPVAIRFQTPVSFSTGSSFFVWPDPKYIFPNLVSIWNVWYPDNAIDEESTVKYMHDHVSLHYAKGSIITVHTGKDQVHKGWVGLVKLGADSADAAEIMFHLLKLGFLTGVGRGRSAGLGRFDFDRVFLRKTMVHML